MVEKAKRKLFSKPAIKKKKKAKPNNLERFAEVTSKMHTTFFKSVQSNASQIYL